MTRFYKLATLIVCGSMIGSAPAFADVVTDWNEIAAASVALGRPGPIGQVDLALVQAAVHDAVQAIEGRFEPYYAEVPGAGGSTCGCRCGRCAWRACRLLFVDADKRRSITTYAVYIANNGLTGDPGLAVGQAVAAAILPLRRLNPNPLPRTTQRAVLASASGVRPTSLLGSPPVPAPFSPMATPWLGCFYPSTLTGPARFRAPPPPSLTSARYTTDYEEVRKVGSLTSKDRSAALRPTWLTSGPTTSPCNGIAHCGQSQSSTYRQPGNRARLFALANLATADALITSWDRRSTTILAAGDGDPGRRK